MVKANVVGEFYMYFLPLSSCLRLHRMYMYFPSQVLVRSSISVTHHWEPTHVLEATLPTPVCLAQMLLVLIQPGVDQPFDVLLQTK